MKRITLLSMLAGLLMVQSATAQSVFSPNVNGVRSSYQNRRAASADAEQERGFFVVTCRVDVSTAAIANKMIELGGTIRSLMGNQLMVELPMSQLDAVAAIDGVLLIDIPTPGTQRTDITRKATHVDEAHQGKADGQQSLPQAYTGKGVIIGLIDRGYDFSHPMFKDSQGNLRIKGVYFPGEEKFRGEGESLEGISTTDEKGVSTTVTLTGSFFTNPDVILDTLKVKDSTDYHGTHCASIAAGSVVEYKGDFKAKDDKSGKLGGMAPEAELFLSKAAVTDEQKKQYPAMKDYLSTYNQLECLYAMKHFADKQGKPLVISWSENGHGGFHDGTSTMARYIGNYCKNGNVMALCASNEGDGYMYISRNIAKGKSLNVICEQTAPDHTSSLFIRTDKEIKVDLAIVDRNRTVVKQWTLALTSKGTKAYETSFVGGRQYSVKDGEWQYICPDNLVYYDAICKQFAGYVNSGEFEIDVEAGNGLDKNNQSFPYVAIYCSGEQLKWPSANDKQQYFPMLIISSPEADVELQGWGDYADLCADTMESPNVFQKGTSDHSMGDYCTSGEAVTIGAYAADIRSFYTNDETGKLELEDLRDEKVGRYASFSSYGTDFSDAHRSYPDVSAPGTAVYAAANSFYPERRITAEYEGQFKGQNAPRKYPYFTASGTSMSTPAAAGVIALWVQAAKDKGRTLTNSDIKDIIKHTSTTDEFTTAAPERYGAGKINAYKGLLYVLGLETSIAELPTKHIGATLNGRTLHIDGDLDTPVVIYNLSGQKVLDTRAVSGIVELPMLPAGVYAVKIGTQGSTLIRL